MGLNIYISHLKDSIILSKIYSRLLFQHIFNKISVSSFGIVYKNVRHSPHKLMILNYGTSAHPLHNSTGLFQKPFVGYGYNHTFVCVLSKPLRLSISISYFSVFPSMASESIYAFPVCISLRPAAAMGAYSKSEIFSTVP